MTDPYDPTANHRISRDSLTASPLDDDRVASMADEGGVSGALMEIDDFGERKRLMKRQRRTMGYARWRTASALFTLIGVAVVAWGWFKRVS
jgi:hypothetical protein